MMPPGALGAGRALDRDRLRPSCVCVHGAITRDRLDRISAMIERGTRMLPVGEVIDLDDASAAHRMLDGAPRKLGKIVLKVAD
jgi:NADPH:quinone reductase-like Zn-dependent oxidoreductase